MELTQDQWKTIIDALKEVRDTHWPKRQARRADAVLARLDNVQKGPTDPLRTLMGLRNTQREDIEELDERIVRLENRLPLAEIEEEDEEDNEDERVDISTRLSELENRIESLEKRRGRK